MPRIGGDVDGERRREQPASGARGDWSVKQGEDEQRGDASPHPPMVGTRKGQAAQLALSVVLRLVCERLEQGDLQSSVQLHEPPPEESDQARSHTQHENEELCRR